MHYPYKKLSLLCFLWQQMYGYVQNVSIKIDPHAFWCPMME